MDALSSILDHDEPTVENRVRQIFAAVFHRPQESFTDDFSPDTDESWDSLGHVNLMTAIEEEFGLALTLEDELAMRNFGLVVLILEEYY